MTPDEWSDAIYEATGMVVAREHARAIGELVAARIKEVEAERDRLREALRQIAHSADYDSIVSPDGDRHEMAIQIALDAIGRNTAC